MRAGKTRPYVGLRGCVYFSKTTSVDPGFDFKAGFSSSVAVSVFRIFPLATLVTEVSRINNGVFELQDASGGARASMPRIFYTTRAPCIRDGNGYQGAPVARTPGEDCSDEMLVCSANAPAAAPSGLRFIETPSEPASADE
jgi:hypothetical protein